MDPYTVELWGPPGVGKTVLLACLYGMLERDDPKTYHARPSPRIELQWDSLHRGRLPGATGTKTSEPEENLVLTSVKGAATVPPIMLYARAGEEIGFVSGSDDAAEYRARKAKSPDSVIQEFRKNPRSIFVAVLNPFRIDEDLAYEALLNLIATLNGSGLYDRAPFGQVATIACSLLFHFEAAARTAERHPRLADGPLPGSRPDPPPPTVQPTDPGPRKEPKPPGESDLPADTLTGKEPLFGFLDPAFPREFEELGQKAPKIKYHPAETDPAKRYSMGLDPEWDKKVRDLLRKVTNAIVHTTRRTSLGWIQQVVEAIPDRAIVVLSHVDLLDMLPGLRRESFERVFDDVFQHRDRRVLQTILASNLTLELTGKLSDRVPNLVSVRDRGVRAARRLLRAIEEEMKRAPSRPVASAQPPLPLLFPPPEVVKTEFSGLRDRQLFAEALFRTIVQWPLALFGVLVWGYLFDIFSPASPSNADPRPQPVLPLSPAVQEALPAVTGGVAVEITMLSPAPTPTGTSPAGPDRRVSVWNPAWIDRMVSWVRLQDVPSGTLFVWQVILLAGGVLFAANTALVWLRWKADRPRWVLVRHGDARWLRLAPLPFGRAIRRVDPKDVEARSSRLSRALDLTWVRYRNGGGWVLANNPAELRSVVAAAPRDREWVWDVLTGLPYVAAVLVLFGAWYWLVAAGFTAAVVLVAVKWSKPAAQLVLAAAVVAALAGAAPVGWLLVPAAAYVLAWVYSDR